MMVNILTDGMDVDADRATVGKSEELKQIVESLRCKKKELMEDIEYLRKENLQYKYKNNDLKDRLNRVNKLMESDVRIFSELFENAKIALEMTRMPTLNSPVQRKTLLPKSPDPRAVSVVQASTSRESLVNRHVTCRKMHIEPLNLQELREITESPVAMDLREEQENSTPFLRGGLSTILEDSESFGQLSVKLERLSSTILEQHLKRQNSLLSNSSFNINDSFDPELGVSSTPLKLETMYRLGLMPSPKNVVDNFVSVRKKDSGSKNSNGRVNGLISPKREKSSPQVRDSLRKKKSPSKQSLRNENSPPKRFLRKENSPKKVNSPPKWSPKKVNSPAKQSMRKENSPPKRSPKKENSPARRSPKKETSPLKSSALEKRTPSRKCKKRENSTTLQYENKRMRSSSQPEGSGRPSRRAKPKMLKEESLKKKKRRD